MSRLGLADAGAPPDGPAGAAPEALDAFVRAEEDGTHSLDTMIGNLHCAGCVQRIEAAFRPLPDIVEARVNLSTRRLRLRWRGGAARAAALIGRVSALGYEAAPFDAEEIARGATRTEATLLRALGVAGFAAANVMLLSVAIWADTEGEMGPATRTLLHWVSALIALPAIAWAGRPFFRSAVSALRSGGVNMDVPISLAVLLTAGVSLSETIQGGEHAYFDAGIMLLFFLLVGRYLDHRTRARARSAAERLAVLGAVTARVVGEDGAERSLPARLLIPGMTVAIAAGERIPADGTVIRGSSDVDTGLVTGETAPEAAGPGARLFAGTMNLTGALRLRVDAVGEDTLLGEIVRLMEAAEQGRARYVRLADRAARLYAPVVHLAALATFLFWLFGVGLAWQPALLIAVSVLIITCPCALGLAVPAVQVVAGSRLLKSGILVKQADALERLAAADTVVFDKTGTLTTAALRLTNGDAIPPAALRRAAAMARESRHPLCRALAAAAPDAPAFEAEVREQPGMGLAATVDAGEIRLGSRAWCGIPADAESDGAGPELWLAAPGAAPVRFAFADSLRADAAEVIAALRSMGLRVAMLSGDRPAVAGAVAAALGIEEWQGGCSPAEKERRLAALAAEGRLVLMVGDGLNDAPALARAHVSMSPAAAADISRTAADLVFQGRDLAPVVEALAVARCARRLVLQNFALAAGYNAIAIPLAVAGLVTPLLAAAAMSASSIVVTLNAVRLNWMARGAGR